jgi:hypothetical protein
MAQCIGCCLSSRDHANLTEDVAQMDLDGVDADVKLEGDLLISGTRHHEAQNLTLTLTDLDIVRHGRIVVLVAQA